MIKAVLFAALAALSFAAFAAGPAQAPASVPPVIKYLQQRGLKVETRFTAAGGLTGYVGTIPGGHRIVFYVPADGSVAIFGQLVDAYGHDLSSAYSLRYIQMPENQKNFAKLASRRWIAQGAVHPRRIIYAFIDPNCPYCWQFWETARKVPNVQVRYLIVGILGESSVGKAAAILAANDPAKALEANENGFRNHEGAIKPLSAVPDALKKELIANATLMQSFGFNGTPGIIWRTQSGEVETSNGLPPPDQLASMLGIGAAPTGPQPAPEKSQPQTP